jgi:hypothetical protein
MTRSPPIADGGELLHGSSPDDGGRHRRRTALTGPNPATGPHKIVALKRPFAVGRKLRPKFMEPSRIARSAQMALDKSVPLKRRFRGLFNSWASSCRFIFSRGEFTCFTDDLRVQLCFPSWRH